MTAGSNISHQGATTEPTWSPDAVQSLIERFSTQGFLTGDNLVLPGCAQLVLTYRGQKWFARVNKFVPRFCARWGLIRKAAALAWVFLFFRLIGEKDLTLPQIRIIFGISKCFPPGWAPQTEPYTVRIAATRDGRRVLVS